MSGNRPGAAPAPHTAILRHYRPADAEALAGVYRDAARVLGRREYKAEQVAAWARHPEDLEAFRATLAAGLTLCAVLEDEIAAFGQLHPADHVAYLYCAPAFAGRGCASAILARLESHARTSGVFTLGTEASRVARPLFERFGFRVVAEERPVRHGVEFVRYRMEKTLDAPPMPRG